jgi:hypothetical protein
MGRTKKCGEAVAVCNWKSLVSGCALFTDIRVPGTYWVWFYVLPAVEGLLRCGEVGIWKGGNVWWILKGKRSSGGGKRAQLNRGNVGEQRGNAGVPFCTSLRRSFVNLASMGLHRGHLDMIGRSIGHDPEGCRAPAKQGRRLGSWGRNRNRSRPIVPDFRGKYMDSKTPSPAHFGLRLENRSLSTGLGGLHVMAAGKPMLSPAHQGVRCGTWLKSLVCRLRATSCRTPRH